MLHLQKRRVQSLILSAIFALGKSIFILSIKLASYGDYGDYGEVLPDTGGPHTASAWVLPGCISLLPSALQLEERMKSQKHSEEEYLYTWTHDMLFLFLSLYHFTSTNSPNLWMMDPQWRRTGRWREKQNSLSACIVIIVTDLARSGSCCLAQRFREVVWVLLITAGRWWDGGQLPKLAIFPSWH